MNLLDAMQIGAAASRRVAAAILVVLVVGTIWFRSETTNLLYGQALDSAAGTANLVGAGRGIHCTVIQDGVLSAATLDCTTGS